MKGHSPWLSKTTVDFTLWICWDLFSNCGGLSLSYLLLFFSRVLSDSIYHPLTHVTSWQFHPIGHHISSTLLPSIVWFFSYCTLLYLVVIWCKFHITTMVVANNTRSKTTPRVWRLQKQCVSLSAKGSSRRCKVASARGTRNYHSPAKEVLRALAPEHGSFNFITPMHRSGCHWTRPVDVEQCNILFPSPECQMSPTRSVCI